MESCNAKYGRTGWLGVATVWTSGGHIVQGTAKQNDTYFTMAKYNKPSWRQLVLCQEIGHTFGLGHQDENFENTNLGSCMDYTKDPDGGTDTGTDYGPGNLYPSAHDYEQLNSESLYGHNDSEATNTSSSASKLPAEMEQINTGDSSQRGALVRKIGRYEFYERNFGAGYRVYTLVILADPEDSRNTHRGSAR